MSRPRGPIRYAGAKIANDKHQSSAISPSSRSEAKVKVPRKYQGIPFARKVARRSHSEMAPRDSRAEPAENRASLRPAAPSRDSPTEVRGKRPREDPLGDPSTEGRHETAKKLRGSGAGPAVRRSDELAARTSGGTAQEGAKPKPSAKLGAPKAKPSAPPKKKEKSYAITIVLNSSSESEDELTKAGPATTSPAAGIRRPQAAAIRQIQRAAVAGAQHGPKEASTGLNGAMATDLNTRST